MLQSCRAPLLSPREPRQHLENSWRERRHVYARDRLRQIVPPAQNSPTWLHRRPFRSPCSDATVFLGLPSNDSYTGCADALSVCRWTYARHHRCEFRKQL